MFTFLSFYLSDIESYKPLSNIWYCYAEHQTAIKDFFKRYLFLKIYQHSWIIIGSTPMYFHEILMDFAEKTNCSHIIQVSDHEMAKTAQDREPHLSLTPTCLWLQTLKLWDWSCLLFKSRGIRFCCLSTNFQVLVYFKDKEYALLYFGAVASCFDK